MTFCLLIFFLNLTVWQKNIPEYHQGVKQFGIGWILCPMFSNYLDNLSISVHPSRVAIENLIGMQVTIFMMLN